MALPPTGRKVETTEIHILRLYRGKLAEHWSVTDHLDLLRQLRVIPPDWPPQSTEFGDDRDNTEAFWLAIGYLRAGNKILRSLQAHILSTNDAKSQYSLLPQIEKILRPETHPSG